MGWSHWCWSPPRVQAVAWKPAMPPGKGQCPPSRAHHGADLEKVGIEEVDADETQLPGVSPAGLPRQLSRELHGVPGPGLRRAKNRLSLVAKASSPAPTPFLAPPPVKPSAFPSSPQSLHLPNPPPWLQLLLNFQSSGPSVWLLQP